MRFLIDNSLSPRLALELGRLGHEVVHLRALGLAAADDRTIFERARSEARVLVAQDADFAAILAQTRSHAPSELLLRTRLKSTETILRTLVAQLPDVSSSLESGAIVVIEDARIRIRGLPLDE
ncbi:MAG: DUF5615 family PIN-like protein [Planctomycetes bacterium]|nr:DUF5615 family PIN-like protein [Planctomycetota bacterium]